MNQKIVGTLMDSAKNNILKYKKLIPVCAIVNGRGEFRAYELQWNTDEEKRQQWVMMGTRVVTENARLCVFINESWMALAPKDWKEGDPYTAPSKSPVGVGMVVNFLSVYPLTGKRISDKTKPK